MKIELSRSGGFFASLKKASAEVDWTDDEVEKIISAIEQPGDSQKRDAVYYTLDLKDKSVPINLGNVPEQYKDVFDNLQKNLKNEPR